jgi:hypothetical protein
VARDGYFFEGLNILINTLCVCDDCFQGLSKAFHCPIYTILNFLFASLKLLNNFEKILTETISSADLSLAAWKMCENEVTGGFQYDFTESQAASCKHFQCQNCRRLEGFSKLVSNFKGTD